MTAIMLVDKVSRETYLVAPRLVPEISEDLTPRLLVPYVTRDGTIGIWTIRLPGEDGRLDSYNETALEIAATYADGTWFRLRTNQTNSTYWAQEMTEKIECPVAKWPEGGFDPIFQRAFKNRIITSLNDRILRVLRGELL